MPVFNRISRDIYHGFCNESTIQLHENEICVTSLLINRWCLASLKVRTRSRDMYALQIWKLCYFQWDDRL